MSKKLSFKQRRLIAGLKKRKIKIDKMTEELKKMAKLVLKDGKLQDVEEVSNEVPEQPQDPNDVPPMPPPGMVQQEQVVDVPPPMQPMPPIHMAPPPADNARQAPFEGMQMPRVPQPIPPQQFVQQPTMQQVPEKVHVTIRMIEGEVIKVSIPGAEIQAFLTALSESIDNQSVYQIGSRVLNGRNIIYYFFE